MPLTTNDLNAIKRAMPVLDFGHAHGRFVDDPLVQSYLNHYRINFSRELDGVSHNFGYFQAPEFKLACHIWRPGVTVKGTIIFKHGYTDNVGLMQHALRAFLCDGWAVVAFDLPGHGLSSGKIGCIGSFDQYRACLDRCLKLARGNLPKPWNGAGQSTGGAIWFNYLRQHDSDSEVNTVVMFAPLVRILNWHRLKFLFPILRHVTSLRPRVFSKNSNDPEFLAFVKNHDLMQPPGTPMRWVAAMRDNIDAFMSAPKSDRPLKIISGDCDRTVDADWNLNVIKEKFPQADITVIPGVRHQVVNESESLRHKIFTEALDWLNQFKAD
ncbi:alpha/beta hydrolase [Candidatus Pelagadaptatus aseana]|uniref:alpha/beta hydrolase n=1 Tax=Candidatus Pelagadaptatus aseana TaxID=3120508 RepID=UPI003C702B1A